MRASSTIAFAALSFCLACGASNKDALIVDGVPPKKEPPADAEHYMLTGATAQVEVDINGVVSYTLAFPEVSGELHLAAESPADSTATLVVSMKSGTTSDKKLEEIAKSKDFLDVETYPNATFEVRQLNNAPSGDYEMVGLLEMHGTTKAITVPFAFTVDACRAQASTAFAINRRKFGVESDTFLDGMASDDVDVRVKIVVPRQNAAPTCGNPSPP